jgi:hypothetical protein
MIIEIIGESTYETFETVDRMNLRIQAAMKNESSEYKHAEPMEETRVLKKQNGNWTLVDNVMTATEFKSLMAEIIRVNDLNDVLLDY